MKIKLRAYLWLSVAIICLITGIHQTITRGFSESYMFFLFTTFALLFFLYYNNLRKNSSNN
jgi:Ca2+/Na+ antiporter